MTTSSKSSNTGIIAGAAAGGAALLVLVLVLFVYALHRKNKSVRATGKNNPFGMIIVYLDHALLLSIIVELGLFKCFIS